MRYLQLSQLTLIQKPINLMGLKSFFAKIWATNRAKQITYEAEHAISIQHKVFSYLIRQGRKTAFGRQHDFERITSYEDFRQQVPVRNYEQCKAYFDRIYMGEPNVSWPGRPSYLAKTSGTTSGAKYIPVTKAAIKKQVQGARDALLLYIQAKGNADFLNGKMMFLSGSPELEENEYGMKVGRLSGIVNHVVPAYLQRNKIPDYETNCIEEWETKLKTIIEKYHQEDLRLISGIPPWVQMFFEELEAQTGKRPLEVWPNLQLFVQGGVNYQPYKAIFDQYFGEAVDVLEVFPASEGFFALQNEKDDEGLLLMPDYGIFYEFIPLEEYGKPDASRLTLGDVKLGKQYALIISTNAGLWAYDIGDTVRFTSLEPYKVRVSGRVKHFISAFGEHVIGEEVEKAMIEAAKQTGAEIQEFTVAPLIVEEKGQSCHEWLIEFLKAPQDLSQFAQILDKSLCKQNTYYNDLREGNILRQALVRKLKVNAARRYMKSIGKLGGQNKFPRLSNTRKIIEALYIDLEQPIE